MKRPTYPDIEVRADAMNLFISAFAVFPSIARKYLQQKGLIRLDDDGKLKPEHQYIPLSIWLETFDAVLREIGPNALFKVGQSGVRNPNFPATVHDLEGALRQVDLAYHLSHRKGGKPMLDKVTGRMLEGIGHYTVERHAGEKKKIFVQSDTPYPCPGELGLLSGIAVLFEPRAVVRHDARGCRMQGADQCRYIVSW